MKTIYSITAILLFIGALAGIIFSAFSLFVFWRSQNEIQTQFVSSFVLVNETLSTTREGLSVVNQTINQAQADLELIESFTFEVSDAVGNTRPTLETLSVLFGEDLQDILVETQDSLVAAESSAILIDDTLRIISSIPLLGTRYAPSEPLGESIGQIAIALSSLPDSLTEIQDGLDDTAEDLYNIEVSIDNLAERIGIIDSNLEEAGEVIENYQSSTTSLQKDLDTFELAIPGLFRKIKFGVSFLLAWISIASLGMFSAGTLMWNHSRNL